MATKIPDINTLNADLMLLRKKILDYSNKRMDEMIKNNNRTLTDTEKDTLNTLCDVSTTIGNQLAYMEED